MRLEQWNKPRAKAQTDNANFERHGYSFNARCCRRGLRCSSSPHSLNGHRITREERRRLCPYTPKLQEHRSIFNTTCKKYARDIAQSDVLSHTLYLYLALSFASFVFSQRRYSARELCSLCVARRITIRWKKFTSQARVAPNAAPLPVRSQRL